MDCKCAVRARKHITQAKHSSNPTQVTWRILGLINKDIKPNILRADPAEVL